jgi:hypothetical protein
LDIFGLGQKILARVENSRLGWTIPGIGRNFQSLGEISRLCSWPIILEDSAATQPPWPGILWNPFCSVLSRPPRPQLVKLVPYIPLPSIVVIGLRKPYTKTEVGTGLVIYDVY